MFRTKMYWLSIVTALLLFCTACASTGPTVNSPSGDRHEAVGLASYYADKFHGRTTASGETYNKHEMTAAHRTLPFGTVVRVRAVETRKSVVVRINDRGPFVDGRVIDLSYAAARDMGMIQSGLIEVELEVIQW